MIEEIKRLIKAKDICVLATVLEGVPHCSLMNYVADEDCSEIYMATQKNTKKYKSLTQNNTVSILVDTREENAGADRPEAKAITIAGVFQKIEDEKKKAIVTSRLLEKHPYMNVIINSKDPEIFCVKITSFLYLDGLKKAHFEAV